MGINETLKEKGTFNSFMILNTHEFITCMIGIPLFFPVCMIYHD